jgi:hypothetical protein
VSLFPVVFIPQEGPMETSMRKLTGLRVFTAMSRRRQGGCVPAAQNGAAGAEARKGS